MDNKDLEEELKIYKSALNIACADMGYHNCCGMPSKKCYDMDCRGCLEEYYINKARMKNNA